MVEKKVTIPSETVSLPMDSPAWTETQVDFVHNFGNLLQTLELVPGSRKYVVPTEWQVRTVLGDCISKAKVRRFLEHTRRSIVGHELDQGPT